VSPILLPQVQQFIRDHEQDDERQLVLKHKDIFGIPAAQIAAQISARRKAREKLPTFYQSQEVLFPPAINLEQSSSEDTARFKSKLLQNFLSDHQMKSVVDLTGGMGVDTLYLSKIFSTVDYVEIDEQLYNTTVHNHTVLACSNVIHHHCSALEFLTGLKQAVDLVFIDPSRRTANKKVFSLADSEPDVLAIHSEIFAITEHLLVKASPLMDIKLALTELKTVKAVFVVAVDNEVKEVLFFCKNGFREEPVIEAVNLSRKGSSESFRFLFSEEEKSVIETADPQFLLYEPNASILKAGAFKSVAERFGLKKIHPNTHLYTGTELLRQFPGRIFEVAALSKPDKKMLRQFFPDGKANVITRNYPMTVDELKKKTGLHDGGDQYLIAFSGQTEKFVAVARRLQ
jgi:16S rRNA G966 N2-methylase RsmD